MSKVAVLSRMIGNDPVARERLARAGVDVVVDLARYEALMTAPDGRRKWLSLLGEIEGLVVGLQPVDEELFAAAPNLRYVLRMGTGVDNVDVAAAERRGVAVSNLHGRNADAVAEYAFGLLLAAARRIPEADALVRSMRWGRLEGRHLGGRTLGLIGFGAIARAMVPKARGFGMDVLVYRRHPDPAEDSRVGVRSVALDELLTSSQFISVHVPLTPQTRHLIGRREVGLMDGVVLVNTARGEIVDEAALYEGLTSGRIAACALDVFATEPPVGSPLLGLRNVVLSPHNGGYSDTAVRAMVDAAVDFIIDHAGAHDASGTSAHVPGLQDRSL